MAEAANFELVVFKHVCKFCKKSFPCGRSLGGHMRSHLSSSSSSSSSDRIVDDQGKLVIIPIKNKKNKDSSKKTWRSVAEESSDDHDHDQEDHALRSCRECGKVFQSSKALFGHMKSTHSQKERLLNNNTNNHHSLVDEYWGSGASNQKLEAHLDSPSENDESTVAPPAAANANRLRRSSRRRGRYMGTATTSSSMSLANNNASSSVSEIDQHEQEEVALCLIMLSKDMGQWGGSCSFPNTLNSPTAAAAAAESSEIKNSLSLEAEKKTVGKGKNCTFSSSEVDNTKLKRQASSYECFYSGGGGGGRSKMEFSTSGNLKNRPKIRKSQVSDHGYARDDDQENKCKLNSGDHEIEVQLRKELSSNNGGMLFRGGESGTTKGNIQWKRKLSDICDESDKSEKISKLSSDGKRIKFECATCNKVFNSYQALGGHRASHKKIKGCSSLKPESNELDCLETAALSPPRLKADGKLEQTTETVNGPKKDQKHECPICFKVFLSGQALGGHKRSHQIAGLEATTSNHHQGIAFQKPTQEIREFLDLNLPAPVEDVGLSPWWHEPLLGLISETI